MTEAAALLEKLTYQGLKKLGKLDDPRYRERLRRELDIITEFNLEDYFLVLWDFAVKYADKELNTIRGPGRGSAAGSVVVYALGITKLDPIEEELPFSRFMNRGRLKKMAMPDVDLDFSASARDKVIEYLINKYGEDYVCGIGNVGKYEAKAAIRAATRALGKDYMLGEQIANIYPPPIHGKSIKLADAYERTPELKAMREGGGDAAEVLELAEKLEGHIEKIGVHAAGIILSPIPLTDIVPLARSNKGIPVTQYPMEDVEALGLIKYDLLVISNLDIIEDTLKAVEKNRDEKVDIYNLPKDDQKTFDLINSGLLAGVFQLEGSAGMKEVVRGIHVRNVDDISACVALFRPGPLDAGLTQAYIQIRQGLKEPEYLHPSLEKVIGDTKGIVIYQEQVMKIATELAGFSEEEADDVRKALGKKKEALLKSLGPKFIQGLIDNSGFTKEQAEELWKNLVLFSGYSFNRCLPLDTQVVLPDGSYITLSIAKRMLEEGREVRLLSSNGKPNKVEAVEYVGEMDVLRVELNTGGVFYATKDHKFMVESDGEVWMLPLWWILIFELSFKLRDGRTAVAVSASTEPRKEKVYNVVLKDEPHDFVINGGVIASNSHSRSYGEIAYWTAYLKAHYPAEFMAAVMTHRAKKLENFPRYIYECKELGVDVLPPNVNESMIDSEAIGKNKIIWGLGCIKNVGKAAQAVVKEREKNGPYKSVADLKLRLVGSGATKKQIEHLILAGAFDSLYSNRGIALQELEAVIKYQEQMKKYDSKIHTYKKRMEAYGKREAEREFAKMKGKKMPPRLKEPVSPEKPKFDFDPNKIDRRRLMKSMTALKYEEELLGTYVSYHPIDLTYAPTEEIDKVMRNVQPDDIVTVCGMIESSAFRVSKKGNNYMMGTISDNSATIPIVAFKHTIANEDTASLLKKGRLVELTGKVTEKAEGYGLIVQEVKPLTQRKDHVPSAAIDSVEILDEAKARSFVQDLGWKSSNKNFTLTINLISGRKIKIKRR